MFSLLSSCAILIAGPEDEQIPFLSMQPALAPKQPAGGIMQAALAKYRKQATIQIYKQAIHPITPPSSLRARFSRRMPSPEMWFEPQFTNANGALTSWVHFAVVERHRAMLTPNGGKAGADQKPQLHPRDGVTVLTGYFDSTTGVVYLLNLKAGKHVKAADHPRVNKADKTSDPTS